MVVLFLLLLLSACLTALMLPTAMARHESLVSPQGSLLLRRGGASYVVLEIKEEEGEKMESFAVFTRQNHYDDQAKGTYFLLYIVRNGKPEELGDVYDGLTQEKIPESELHQRVMPIEHPDHAKNFPDFFLHDSKASRPKVPLTNKVTLLHEKTADSMGLVWSTLPWVSQTRYQEFDLHRFTGGDAEVDGKLYIFFEDNAYHEVPIPHEWRHEISAHEHKDHHPQIVHNLGTEKNVFPKEKSGFEVIKHKTFLVGN